MATANALVKCATITVEGTGAPSGGLDYPTKAVGILTTQAWKQTSGDPSGQTWIYSGITLLYNFKTASLYMVFSVTMARIVARLLNIY